MKWQLTSEGKILKAKTRRVLSRDKSFKQLVKPPLTEESFLSRKRLFLLSVTFRRQEPTSTVWRLLVNILRKKQDAN